MERPPGGGVRVRRPARLARAGSAPATTALRGASYEAGGRRQVAVGRRDSLRIQWASLVRPVPTDNQQRRIPPSWWFLERRLR